MKSSHLSWRDALLALTIVIVWGTNFVAMRIALDALPPLFMATVRFSLVLFPAILFLPRPNVSWRNLMGYGVFIGFLSFSLLFIAMNGMISPGLASLVVQSQAFFFVGIGMVRHKEKLAFHQAAAFLLALIGMGLIMAHGGQGATVAGVCLTLGSAMSWAIGNQISKEAAAPGQINALAYVVWGNLFSVPLLAAASWFYEGWPAIAAGLSHATPATWGAVLWQSIANTLFAYVAWMSLIGRYPAAAIAPFTLLVPIVGMATSALWLGEPLQDWKLAACALVLAAMALNLFWRKKSAPMPVGEPS